MTEQSETQQTEANVGPQTTPETTYGSKMLAWSLNGGAVISVSSSEKSPSIPDMTSLVGEAAVISGEIKSWARGNAVGVAGTQRE
jgi:hypothetical protein